MPSPKNLDDILKLDTLADKTPEEIEAIWMEVRACLHLALASGPLPGYNHRQIVPSA